MQKNSFLDPCTLEWVHVVCPQCKGVIQSLGDVKAAVSWRMRWNQMEPFIRVWSKRLTLFLKNTGTEVANAYRLTGATELIQATLPVTMKARLQPIYRAMYYDVQKSFIRTSEQAVKAEEEWEVVDPYALPEMQSWNDSVTGTRITNVAQSTVRAVQRAVAAGLAEGYSVDRIAKDLQRDFAFSSYRAKMIAQTEILSAANAATHFSMGANLPTDGMTKSWLTAGDGKVRDDHVVAGATQRRVPYHDPFRVGGERLMFPGDSSLGASGSQIIHCRCTTLYFKGELPPPTPAPTTPTAPPKPRGRPPGPPKPKPAPKPRPAPKPKPVIPPKPTVPAGPKPLSDGRIKKFTRAAQTDKETASLKLLTQDFSRTPGLDQWLVEHPLTKYTDDNKSQARRTLGYYVPGRGTMTLNTKAISYMRTGRPWEGLFSTSGAATDTAMARRMVFTHELGHHIDSRANMASEIAGTFRARKSFAITKYGSTNSAEYFAESFTAYVYNPTRLQQVDLAGYNMVVAVLKKIGVTIV